jgi:DNA-binding winged helix-turn-helix (wHTH) protein
MGNPVESSHYVGFGEFELDLRTRELLVGGSKFDLQEQPFQVLSLLLERPGELVTREELTQRLWPADTFVDFEHSLNRVITRLRQALDDSAEQPRFIETLPRRRYRFVATVRHVSRAKKSATEERLVRSALVSEGQDSTGAMGSQNQPPATSQQFSDDNRSTVVDTRRHETPVVRSWRQRVAFFILVPGLGCLAGLLTFWLLSPAPILRIVRSRQITTSGKVDPWGLMASDGSRIYFLEREGDHWNLLQTSVSRGESQMVAAPFRNTRVLDVSPDHTSLLIASFASRGPRMPLWIWPVQGGPPKRVGEITAYDASWCPNGRQILYSEDDGIYQIDGDGTNAHKFVTTDGPPWFFSWSPDGHRLRFTLDSQHSIGSAIWQVDSDGTHFRRLLRRVGTVCRRNAAAPGAVTESISFFNQDMPRH